MSRTSSLWAAGAVALLFALVIGAVVMRPVLKANADEGQRDDTPAVVTMNDDPAGWDGEDDAWDDDDDWENDDDYEDEDHEDDEYEEHEGEHQDGD